MSNVFDLTTARFSAATALSLAQFSLLAYDEPGAIRAVIEQAGMAFSWIEDRAADTQLFVASDEHIIVVCFRGTAERRDWLTDLDTKTVEYENTEQAATGSFVHRGFWIAYALIVQKLFDVMKKHGGNSKSVLVTGHSLGGALAAIAAYEIAQLRVPVRLYTFGQPRVGDDRFVKSVAGSLLGYHRFVNNNDVVPRVPPVRWGFRHAGRLNHFSHQGKLLLDTSPWIILVDRILGRIKDIGKWGTDGIKDHSMKAYVDLVRGMANPGG